MGNEQPEQADETGEHELELSEAAVQQWADPIRVLPPMGLSTIHAEEVLGHDDFMLLIEERERLAEKLFEKRTVEEAMANPHPLDHASSYVFDRKSPVIREIYRKHGGNRLGKRLRDYRKQAGLRQVDVYAKTGISNQLLEDIESGKREVTTIEAALLAEAYGVPMPVLLGIETEDEHGLLESFRKMPLAKRRALLDLFTEGT
ncbi:helix-turn-helix domain-containing protein [Olsenella sp. Marseille-P4559]|uniref:helix-turn-helix domain-containing protein n=1 Tax=Olsenella sp. Marseille-P4559 TaxID=2364795 RepID=UPI00102F6F01|nr:helix-turn-helix transcriptional regulator [Olsenella sp. Marseille-P4559]